MRRSGDLAGGAWKFPGLNDTKKLTDKKRRELFPIIEEQALAYGIGWASQEEIDDINILAGHVPGHVTVRWSS